MLRKSALRRIVIATLALFVFLMIYLFPIEDDKSINNTTYIESIKSPIYLVDKNNYVARINILKKGNNLLENIKNVIESLTIDSNNSVYLPSGFEAVIPKNTKLKDLSLNNKILKLEFSKEFLSVDLENEEKMYEAIIYSLTEFNEVDGIMIFVDNERVIKLKNGKILPTILDRNFGINKHNDLNCIKNISKTTTYYTMKNDDFTYFVPITMVNNDASDKIQIIIKNLKTSPINQTNLTSYLASSANLENYEILENTINLSFNNDLIPNMNSSSILEEVKYSIFLSLRDTYNVKSVVFELPNNDITTVN